MLYVSLSGCPAVRLSGCPAVRLSVYLHVSFQHSLVRICVREWTPFAIFTLVFPCFVLEHFKKSFSPLSLFFCLGRVERASHADYNRNDMKMFGVALAEKGEKKRGARNLSRGRNGSRSSSWTRTEESNRLAKCVAHWANKKLACMPPLLPLATQDKLHLPFEIMSATSPLEPRTCPSPSSCGVSVCLSRLS